MQYTDTISTGSSLRTSARLMRRLTCERQNTSLSLSFSTCRITTPTSTKRSYGSLKIRQPTDEVNVMALEMICYLSHACLVQTHSIAVLRNIGLDDDDGPVFVYICTVPIALRTSSSNATAGRHVVVQRCIEFFSNQSCVDLLNVVADAVSSSSSRVFFSLWRVHR